MIMIMTINVIT